MTTKELAKLITESELDKAHTNKEYYRDRIKYWEELLLKFIQESK